MWDTFLPILQTISTLLEHSEMKSDENTGVVGVQRNDVSPTLNSISAWLRLARERWNTSLARASRFKTREEIDKSGGRQDGDYMTH